MNPKDNLTAWKALVVATKTGSISRTALVLDMELTRVSRLLADLEAALGFSLFDKSRRPMRPTAPCIELVRQVEPLVDGFRKLLSEEKPAEETLVIRFAAPNELMSDFFASYLCTYSEQHPEITFSLLSEIGPEQMHAAPVDVAVVNHRPDDESGLVLRHFNASATVPLASPEYLKRRGVPKTIEDLAAHTGLLQDSPNNVPTAVLYQNGHPSPPIRWKRTLLASDQLVLKRLVLEHQGIALDLFLGHVVEDIQARRIVPVLPGWERTPWHMALVTRTEDEQRSPRLRAFAEWFANYAGNALRVVARSGWRALNRSGQRKAPPTEPQPVKSNAA